MNFYLPANNIPLLKKIAGFEDFDPQTEVLHCGKLGTDLVHCLPVQGETCFFILPVAGCYGLEKCLESFDLKDIQPGSKLWSLGLRKVDLTSSELTRQRDEVKPNT